MAQSNKRYFNTFFFEDPYIEGLDTETRFLYITMILNPHNNLAGCYEVSINKLVNYTALPEDKVRIGIQKLQDDRKILFSGNWLSLKNFIKNNDFNPNMCKKAFDIMKAAPKDKIIFILSDSSGNAEPWVEEFVNKVETGINQSIDSQNRNQLSRSKKLGLPSPRPKQYENLTVESFTDVILSDEKRTLGGTIGGTIGGMVREPCGEVEEEREYEEEKEIEIEKEYEEGTITQPFETYKPENQENSESIMDTVRALSEKKKA